jgi:hypothetical protein
MTRQIDPSHLKDHIRYANTPQRLHTGGKSSSTRQQLFSVYIDGLRILDPEWRHGIGDTAATVIDPWLFTINGAAPGSDGYVYFLLANNSTVDITPTVSYAYYVYDIYPTKHTLYVTANSQQLSRESTTTTEFCVGQKISLSPSFVPAVPGFQSYTAAQWSLGGNYVDDWTQSSSSASKNYYVNSSKLTQQTTDAWWRSAGTGLRAYLGVNLQFQNGKTINGVVGDGYFNMYSPSVTMSGVTPRHFWANQTFSNELMKLRLGEETPPGQEASILDQMRFDFNFASSPSFPGEIAIQQLCVLGFTAYNVSWSFTDWRRDGSEFYEGPLSMTTANWIMTFNDSPYGISNSPNRVKGSFKTYAVFRPQPSTTSIWVTLGRADWNMNGSISFSGYPPIATFTSQSTSDPSFTQTNEPVTYEKAFP